MRLQSCEKVMESCTAQCKTFLFSVKTVVRESGNFDLVHLKKEEDKKINFGNPCSHGQAPAQFFVACSMEQ